MKNSKSVDYQNVFDKVLKSIISSTRKEHLESCRRYYAEFERAFFVTEDMKTRFESNLEKKRIEILKNDLNERNGRSSKDMALQRGFTRFHQQ